MTKIMPVVGKNYQRLRILALKREEKKYLQELIGSRVSFKDKKTYVCLKTEREGLERQRMKLLERRKVNEGKDLEKV